MSDTRKVALSPHVRDALRATIDGLLRSGDMTRTELIDDLAKFGYDVSVLPDEPIYRGHNAADIFLTDPPALSKILSRGFSDFQDESKAFYLYFTEKYPNVLEKEIKIAKMKLEEGFVRTAHMQFSGSVLMDMTVAGRLKGEYQLYRRSPFDPDNTIFACKLSIGVDSDFDCKFETSDNDQHFDAGIEAVGKLVPFSNNTDRFTAFLAAPDGAGQFIFQFDRVTVYPTKRKVLKGIVTSAFGGSRSSAWPVIAISSASELAPSIKKLGISDLENMPPEISEELNRGAIMWNERFDVTVKRRPTPQ